MSGGYAEIDMTETPRHSWFRIHLSTAVILMVVASVIFGLLVNFARAPIHLGNDWSEKYRRHVVDHVNVSRAVTIVTLIPVSLVVLFVIGMVCEWIIRRREARNGS